MARRMGTAGMEGTEQSEYQQQKGREKMYEQEAASIRAGI